MSLRKSSRRRNGSKSAVVPKPNARRRCTPAPSRAEHLLDLAMGALKEVPFQRLAHGLPPTSASPDNARRGFALPRPPEKPGFGNLGNQKSVRALSGLAL